MASEAPKHLAAEPSPASAPTQAAPDRPGFETEPMAEGLGTIRPPERQAPDDLAIQARESDGLQPSPNNESPDLERPGRVGPEPELDSQPSFGNNELPGANKLKPLFDDSALLEASKLLDASDKGGSLTTAGRALQKHGDRPSSSFQRVTGDSASINLQGHELVTSILSDPNKTYKYTKMSRYGEVLDVRASDGRGLRFTADGKKLIGLLEPEQ